LPVQLLSSVWRDRAAVRFRRHNQCPRALADLAANSHNSIATATSMTPCACRTRSALRGRAGWEEGESGVRH